MKKRGLFVALFAVGLMSATMARHMEPKSIMAKAEEFGNVNLTFSNYDGNGGVYFNLDKTISYNGDWSVAFTRNDTSCALYNGVEIPMSKGLPFHSLADKSVRLAVSDTGIQFVAGDIITISGTWKRSTIDTFTIAEPITIEYTGNTWLLYEERPESVNVSISISDFVNNATLSNLKIIEQNNEYIKLQAISTDPYVTFRLNNKMFLAAYSIGGISFDYKFINIDERAPHPTGLYEFVSLFRYHNITAVSQSWFKVYDDWSHGALAFVDGDDGQPLSSVRWDISENYVLPGETYFYLRNIVIHDVPVERFIDANVSSITVRDDSSNPPEGQNGISLTMSTTAQGTAGYWDNDVYYPFTMQAYSLSENTNVGLIAKIARTSSSGFTIVLEDTQYFFKNGNNYRFSIAKGVSFDGNLMFMDEYLATATYVVNNGVYSLTNWIPIDDYEVLTAEEEFTHKGLFSITKNSSNYSYNIYSEEEASTIGVPTGFEGAVLKTVASNNSSIALDFSNSQIPYTLVESVDFRFYSTDTPAPDLVKPEFRIQVGESGPWVIGTGDGGYRYGNNVNEWFKFSINSSTFRNSSYSFRDLSNSDGYLAAFNARFRTVTSCVNYVDYINLTLKPNDGNGPVISSDYGQCLVVNAGSELPVIATAFDFQENRDIPVTCVFEDGSPIINNRIDEVGDYVIVVTAVDFYGNASVKRIPVIVLEPDHEAPVININMDEITIPVGTFGSELDFGHLISDNSGRFDYTVTYSDNTFNSIKQFVLGDHSVTIVATDLSGNSSSKTIIIHVVNDYSFPADGIDEDAYYQEVRVFIATYLHMDDYNENLGYCSDAEHHYYDDAKEAYNALSGQAKYLFLNDDEFAPAKERLIAWAHANNDEFNPDGVISARIGSIHFVNNSLIIFVVTISLFVICSSILLARTIVLKKKKHK